MKPIVLLLVVLVLGVVGSWAQIPHTMSYQGVLTDSTGAPKPDGSYAFTFRLYDALNNGNVVGTQAQTLAVKRGLFHTVFDQLLSGVSMDRPYWLSVQVGSDPELAPRLPLTAAPYSLSAAHADTARFAINSPPQGVVDSARVAGTVANGAITASKIATGQVVKSINGQRDNVVVTATGGATISSRNDSIVINNVAGWSLTGNAGTNPGANFVGTTDAQPFTIRTNNLPRAQITTKGQIVPLGTGASIFLGEGAGESDNGGNNGNVLVGFHAGMLNTNGQLNTASGFGALASNASGSNNTALGASALLDNSTGVFNTAVGSSALEKNTGFDNTAVGAFAMQNATSGQWNTAFGYAALKNTSIAQQNTAVGFGAGSGYDNGYNNVFVGSGADVTGGGYFNVIAIGQGTAVGANSTARFGNTSTISYGGWAGWSNVSDGRFKRNVKTDVPGLAFITRLRPITYNLDATGLEAFLHRNAKPTLEVSTQAQALQARALQAKEAITYSGFVAQEVEAAAKEIGYDFSGVDAPKNANDYYGLRYAEFVVPLVKAIQEQQQMIEKQQKEIDQLKAEVTSLGGVKR